MKIKQLTIGVALCLSALALVAWGGDRDEQMKEGTKAVEHIVFAEFVSPEDSLSKLRYLDDGLVSLNDRCPVRKVRLNPKMPPAYVNGLPIGFC